MIIQTQRNDVTQKEVMEICNTAIERGMQPKVLQQLLGHASIKTTMDRYVHVTDESLVNAVRQFETATPTTYQKRA